VAAVLKIRARDLARDSLGRLLDLVDQRRRTAPATKIGLRRLQLEYRRALLAGEPLPSAWDIGFRVFSEFDEDGIALFLLAVGGSPTRRFVDIGAGDCVFASNTANLALNLGFDGLFVDADVSRIEHGRRFYARHPDAMVRPPVFVRSFVTRENVDDVVAEAGFTGEIDLLSIDIDGNDYWIWEVLNCVSPRIVVVETHPELGMRPIVVPYDAHLAAGSPPEYLGASPVGMTKLAQRLGYRLAGANRFGFNLFYLREDLVPAGLARVDLAELLRHDRIRARERLFDAIAHLPYVEV
jgi:hypothetical protein